MTLIENYLQHLKEGWKPTNKGKFAYGFIPAGLILIFETKGPVTGSDNAYLMVKGIKKLSDIKSFKSYPVSFGQTWSLNFKEVMASYGKGYKKGKYESFGTLEQTVGDKKGASSFRFFSTILTTHGSFVIETGTASGFFKSRDQFVLKYVGSRKI